MQEYCCHAIAGFSQPTRNDHTGYRYGAQEAEDAVPELVRRTDDGTMSLAVEEIIPFLVKRTQDLRGALRKECEEQAALADRIGRLEQALKARGPQVTTGLRR